MQGNTIITITGLNQVQQDHYNEIAINNGLKTIKNGTVRVTLASLRKWDDIVGAMCSDGDEWKLFEIVDNIIQGFISVDPKNEYSM